MNALLTPEERRALLALVVLLLLGHGLRAWQDYQRGRPDRELTAWLTRMAALRLEEGDDSPPETAPMESVAVRIDGPVDTLSEVSSTAPSSPAPSSPAPGSTTLESAPPESTDDDASEAIDRAIERTVVVEPRSKVPAGLLEVGKICLDRATEADFRTLPGIGPSLAARIVAARATSPFVSVDDLERVPGIGPRKLESLRPLVVAGCPE